MHVGRRNVGPDVVAVDFAVAEHAVHRSGDAAEAFAAGAVADDGPYFADADVLEEGKRAGRLEQLLIDAEDVLDFVDVEVVQR